MSVTGYACGWQSCPLDQGASPSCCIDPTLIYLNVRDYTFNWTFLEYRKEIEVKLFPLALMWTISISENLSKFFFCHLFWMCFIHG